MIDPETERKARILYDRDTSDLTHTISHSAMDEVRAKVPWEKATHEVRKMFIDSVRLITSAPA